VSFSRQRALKDHDFLYTATAEPSFTFQTSHGVTQLNEVTVADIDGDGDGDIGVCGEWWENCLADGDECGDANAQGWAHHTVNMTNAGGDKCGYL
jgi:hypothetical protein